MLLLLELRCYYVYQRSSERYQFALLISGRPTYHSMGPTYSESSKRVFVQKKETKKKSKQTKASRNLLAKNGNRRRVANLLDIRHGKVDGKVYQIPVSPLTLTITIVKCVYE